jgi:hypothetical protein
MSWCTLCLSSAGPSVEVRMVLVLDSSSFVVWVGDASRRRPSSATESPDAKLLFRSKKCYCQKDEH